MILMVFGADHASFLAVDADYAELQRKMKIMDSDRQKFNKHADQAIGQESSKLDGIAKENARLAKEVSQN